MYNVMLHANNSVRNWTSQKEDHKIFFQELKKAGEMPRKPLSSKNFPKYGGLYTINDRKEPVYAGYTNNLQRRMSEHRSGKPKQWIDWYLRLAGPRGFNVDYKRDNNPGRKEQQYMKDIRKRKGRSSLPFNLTRGNASSNKRTAKRGK